MLPVLTLHKSVMMIRDLFKWLIVSPLLFSACVNDKTVDCGAEVTLSYVYELHNDVGDLFARQVEHLHIYAYDSDGRLVREKNIGSVHLDEGNSVSLEFDGPGRYTFVTWGNIHTDDFTLENRSVHSEMKLVLASLDDEGCLTTPEPGSLFHGLVTADVPGGRKNTAKVSLTNNLNRIKVEIEGIADPATTPLEVFITGRNGMYYYDNSFHPEGPAIRYTGETWTEGKYIHARVPTYRLIESDTEISLTVRSGALTPGGFSYAYHEPLVPVLLEKVRANHQAYLDKTDEFFVYVSFDENGVGTASTVRSWDDVGNETDL